MVDGSLIVVEIDRTVVERNLTMGPSDHGRRASAGVERGLESPIGPNPVWTSSGDGGTVSAGRNLDHGRLVGPKVREISIRHLQARKARER